jgi:hypothetical protein
VPTVADRARRCFDAAVATRCRRGEEVSGDRGILIPVGIAVLVAAIDGAGHGPAAADASGRAAAVVTCAAELDRTDVSALMRQCHSALRDTRGAAISLACLSSAANTITWLGIGNVEGRILSPAFHRPRRHHTLRLCPGVAGHHMPTLRPATVRLAHGDVIAFASDGVDGAFADALDPAGAPSSVARRILAEHWNGEDDGLVLVIRWLGGGRSRPS